MPCDPVTFELMTRLLKLKNTYFEWNSNKQKKTIEISINKYCIYFASFCSDSNNKFTIARMM